MVVSLRKTNITILANNKRRELPVASLFITSSLHRLFVLESP